MHFCLILTQQWNHLKQNIMNTDLNAIYLFTYRYTVSFFNLLQYISDIFQSIVNRSTQQASQKYTVYYSPVSFKKKKKELKLILFQHSGSSYDSSNGIALLCFIHNKILNKVTNTYINK